MLSLPPPVWAFLYLIVAGATSWFYPWRALIDLRIVWLGVALVAIGVAISGWAFLLFRREGTEIDPTSETNKSLVVGGPFRFTRNPMYLGLVISTLGIAFWVGSLPMFAVPCSCSPPRIGRIFRLRRRRCAGSSAPPSTSICAKFAGGFDAQPDSNPVYTHDGPDGPLLIHWRCKH